MILTVIKRLSTFIKTFKIGFHTPIAKGLHNLKALGVDVCFTSTHDDTSASGKQAQAVRELGEFKRKGKT